VVDQPDSPIKIVVADFKNSFITVSHERFTEQLQCPEGAKPKRSSRSQLLDDQRFAWGRRRSLAGWKRCIT
jgi:hypothetical protein